MHSRAVELQDQAISNLISGLIVVQNINGDERDRISYSSFMQSNNEPRINKCIQWFSEQLKDKPTSSLLSLLHQLLVKNNGAQKVGS